jgi:hypothetical protein
MDASMGILAEIRKLQSSKRARGPIKSEVPAGELNNSEQKKELQHNVVMMRVNYFWNVKASHRRACYLMSEAGQIVAFRRSASEGADDAVFSYRHLPTN